MRLKYQRTVDRPEIILTITFREGRYRCRVAEKAHQSAARPGIDSHQKKTAVRAGTEAVFVLSQFSPRSWLQKDYKSIRKRRLA
jgi:hypothetical protein